MERIAYLSGAWFTVLEQEARKAIQQSASKGLARDFLLLERYSGAPDFALGDGLVPGFKISFSSTGDATVRPGAGPNETADCLLEMDWKAACQSVSQLSGPGLDQLLQDLCASGRVTITGDMHGCPVDLGSFHDAMVNSTFIAD